MKYFVKYEDESSIRMFITLIIFVVIVPKTLSSVNYLSVGSHSQYAHVAPSPSVSHHGKSTNGAVQEKACFVARLCEYAILEEYFNPCKVSNYVVSNGYERTLPKWLWFDEENGTLKGIPSPADEGLNEVLIVGLRKSGDNPVSYICGSLTVKVVVWNLKYFPLFAQTFPASSVIKENSYPPRWQSFTNCQFNEPIVLASLVMAGNYHEKDGKQKIQLLDELLKSFRISIYDILVLSCRKDQALSSLLQTSHVLASGPGANRSASGPCTTLTWHVKCGMIHLDDVLFQVMEKLSQQFTVINNISYAPMGWHVITGVQKQHIRRRRNIGGTTTLAYSTMPISRATVITKKIKITRTTYVSTTKRLTLSRPLPSFSSPYPSSITTSYNQSSIISSQLSNITSSQYKSVTSVKVLLSTMISSSQITSLSKQETSGMSHYGSASSSLPVDVSSTAPIIIPSSKQTLNISVYDSLRLSLSTMFHSRNKSATSEILSTQQISSTSMKASSSRQPIFNSLSIISSLLDGSLFRTENCLTSTGSNIGRTITMSTSTQYNSTIDLVQPSYTKILSNNVTFASVRTYTRVNGSKNLSKIKSTTLNQPFGSFSHTKFPPSIKTTLSTSFAAVTTQRTYRITPSYSINFPSLLSGSFVRPCSNNCSMSTLNRSTHITSAGSSDVLQSTKTPHFGSSITSGSFLSPSSTTGTPVSDATSVILLTSNVDKVPISTTPMLTSEVLLSKSIKSSTHIDVKTNSTIHPSTVALGSDETAQRTSETASVTSLIKPSSSEKTLYTMAPRSSSEYEFTLSGVPSTVRSTAIVYTPTEHLKSTFSSLIKTIITLTTYSLFAAITRNVHSVPSDSIITNIVTSSSVSPVFTSHIPGSILSYTNHSIMSSPSSLTSSIDQSDLLHKSSSSSKFFEKSSSTVVNTSSTLLVLPSYQTFVPTLYSVSVTHYYTPTSLLVSAITHSSSYTTPFPSTVITSITTSDQLLSPHTVGSSSVDTAIISSTFSYSYIAPTSQSTVVRLASPVYRTSVLPSLMVTSTSSFHPLSSYKSGTPSTPIVTSHNSITSSNFSVIESSITTIRSSHQILSSQPSTSSIVATNILSSYVFSSNTTATLISTTTPSLQSMLSYKSSSSLSPSFSIIPPSSLSSSYNTVKLVSVFPTIGSPPVFLSSYHNITVSSNVLTTKSSLSTIIYSSSQSIRSSTVIANTPSSYFMSSFNQATSTSAVITIPSLSLYASYHSPTSSLAVIQTPSFVTNILSPVVLSSHHTSSQSVFTTIVSHSTSYDRSTTTSLINPSSSEPLLTYHTLTSPLNVVTFTSSFFTSHHVPTVTPGSFGSFSRTSSLPLNDVSVTSSSLFLFDSHNIVSSPPSISMESSRTSRTNLPSTLHLSKTPRSVASLASYKTLSFSFLSTTIVSRQTSFPSDLSMMTHSTIGSSMPYTLTKLSSRTPWLPVHTGNQSFRTTAVLTASRNISVITTITSFALRHSSTVPQLTSSTFTPPTTPSKGSPKVYNSFDALRVTVGKVFNVQIPADTFHDREDGNTRSLRLDCLTVTQARLSRSSWLQFNSTTQVLYGLILKTQVGKISLDYFLTASDHDGNTVYDAFTVIIEEISQPIAATLSVKLTGINLETFNRDIGNMLSIVQTIADYSGDKDESMVQVLSAVEGSVIFTWTNASLKTCDEDLINEIASKFMTTQGNIQPDFFTALSPKFIGEEIFVNYTGPCILHSTQNPTAAELSSDETSPWLRYVLPALVVAVILCVIAVICLLVRLHTGVKILKEDKYLFKRRKPVILDGELEMSNLSGKPVELPDDSLTPIRFPRESSLPGSEYDDYDSSEIPSPILPAPPYQRLPPTYNDESFNRYNTPPPPYKLPPLY